MQVEKSTAVIIFGYKKPFGKFIGHYDGEFIRDLLEFEIHERKQNFSLIVYQEFIFQIGGTDFASEPKFNLNQWLRPHFIKEVDPRFDTQMRIDYGTIAQLNTPRKSCALEILGEFLYVFYGEDNIGPVNSIERALISDVCTSHQEPW